MDPLADVLEVSRVRGAVLANASACAPWGIAPPQSTGASLHTITSGTAWLRVDGHEPLQLMPGDLLLLPGGTPHRMSSDLDAACRPFDRALKEELLTPEGDLHLAGGGGATTTFICSLFDYDRDVAQPLMSLLPTVLHVPADPVAGRHVAAMVELLAREVGARDPGARAAVNRLIELLLIAAIRSWTQREGEDHAPSWLAALRDPVIARALALLHERPGDPWTVDALAGAVHLSRATLARRFVAQVGEPPLAYLTRWRMVLAAQRLRSTGETVDTIARGLGYRSEYAFSRTFRRHVGQPPGRYRRALV